jgi:hypothetical protein
MPKHDVIFSNILHCRVACEPLEGAGSHGRKSDAKKCLNMTSFSVIYYTAE